MSETNIFRPLSKEEKIDTIEVGTVTILEKFLDLLSRKRAEYQKLYKPYDGYSARVDFEDKIRKSILDSGSNIISTSKKLNIEMPEWEQYGDENRFELIEVKDTTEPKLVDGLKQSYITGKEYNYRAKPRGNGICIFVPNEKVAEVEARFKKDKVDK